MSPLRAKATLSRYRKTLFSFSTFIQVGLPEVSQEMVSLFISDKAYAQMTLIGRFAVLKHFYSWALQTNFILIDPTAKLDYPKMIKYLPKKIMTLQETKRVLEAVPLNEDNLLTYRDRVILELMYSCSLRRSEVHALNMSDFDYSSRSIRIRAGKTKRGRMIPVGQMVNELLKNYIETLRMSSESKAIFLNYRGDRLGVGHITRIARRARKKSGIRTKASSHSFRKSSATHMLRNGAPLTSVQSLLGHVAITSTEVYTKVYPRDLIKIHRAHHPREKQKNQVMPELKVPEFLYFKGSKKAIK